jgi:hypothetical protein
MEVSQTHLLPALCKFTEGCRKCCQIVKVEVKSFIYLHKSMLYMPIIPDMPLFAYACVFVS